MVPLDLGYDLDFPLLNAFNLSALLSKQHSSQIIIKLIDNRPNFREMKIAERGAFNSALFDILSGPLKTHISSAAATY